MLIKISLNSLLSRRTSVLLTLFSLIVSISVLMSVEHIRHQAKSSFNRTISGVDLIVGARSGQLNLLLYSVFRMGNPTNNIDWDSYQLIKDNSLVNWAVPISLGDSHRGFRVMGTTSGYFTHYKYGKKRSLSFRNGRIFNDVFDTVIGHEVAHKLGYKVGDSIVIAHGIGSTSFSKHALSPFVITGILEPTGTPVDKTVHVTLEGIEAVHLSPARLKKFLENRNEGITSAELTPSSITAVMLGLNSKMATFRLQRSINQYREEPLSAILPGVALAELWQMLGSVENILRTISVLILISSLSALATMLLSSIRERKPEIAVLRAIGAGAFTIFILIITESLLISVTALMCALLLVSGALTIGNDWLVANYGLFIDSHVFTTDTVQLAVMVLLATTATAAIPAFGAYKNALSTGLSGAK